MRAYARTHTHTHTHTRTHARTHTHTHTPMPLSSLAFNSNTASLLASPARMCVYVSVCMCVRVYVCVCLQVYVYVCMRVCVYVHVYTQPSPSSSAANALMLDVLPVPDQTVTKIDGGNKLLQKLMAGMTRAHAPGGPVRMRCGMLPSSAMTRSLERG